MNTIPEDQLELSLNSAGTHFTCKINLCPLLPNRGLLEVLQLDFSPKDISDQAESHSISWRLELPENVKDVGIIRIYTTQRDYMGLAPLVMVRCKHLSTVFFFPSSFYPNNLVSNYRHLNCSVHCKTNFEKCNVKRTGSCGCHSFTVKMCYFKHYFGNHTVAFFTVIFR